MNFAICVLKFAAHGLSGTESQFSAPLHQPEKPVPLNKVDQAGPPKVSAVSARFGPSNSEASASSSARWTMAPSALFNSSAVNDSSAEVLHPCPWSMSRLRAASNEWTSKQASASCQRLTAAASCGIDFDMHFATAGSISSNDS